MIIQTLSTRRAFIRGLGGSAFSIALANLPFAAAQATRDTLFFEGPIPRLRLELSNTELGKLRRSPREYVRGRMIENDQREYLDVGIKLKGAAGSFRGVDDRPALTINIDKFAKQQTFHDLTKIHLNNSVQDSTYLNELICSEIFLAAGVPTARATHARVWLNDRDLGFYGLKEGYDKTFLRRHFKSGNGNLYDGGFLQDINAKLEKDSGDGPDDRSDLKSLAQACQEGNLTKRWASIDRLLDVNAFLTFMALELMTCHWDGYCNNRNNYRVYFDPASSKAYFFPHGMDQMFQDTNASILEIPGALVASTVLQNPEWRTRYHDRVGELLKLFSPADRLIARIDAIQTRIQSALVAVSQTGANNQAIRANQLKDRLIARARNLETQSATADPEPLQFDDQGVAELTQWYPKSESEDARHNQTRAPDGVRSYSVSCGPSGQCVASWRTKVLLAAGTYTLQGRARTSGVAALSDAQGAGAGLRVSGGQRTNKLEGTTDWKVIEHSFRIGSQEIELVGELRATRGQVWFDADSLRLIRNNKA